MLHQSCCSSSGIVGTAAAAAPSTSAGTHSTSASGELFDPAFLADALTLCHSLLVCVARPAGLPQQFATDSTAG